MAARGVALLGMALATGFGAGCGNSAATGGTGTELPHIDVSLPAPPKVPPRKYAATYPDGSISVEEVLRSPEKYLKKDVKVKGIVVWKSELCKPKKGDPPCEMANLLIADAPDEPRLKLMVVDFIAEEFELVQMGHHINVNGQFARTSRTGFVNKDGLVGFKSIEDLDVPEKDKNRFIGISLEGEPGAPGAPGMPGMPPVPPTKAPPGITP